MTVGEKIKNIRKEKGLTQKKLGELCSIDEANIRKYENGKQNPKIETINKIATALNVNICDLVEIPFNSDSAPPHTIKRDVSDILSNIEELLKQEGLTFNGEPISEESINSIISAMKIGMEIAKQNNKKYTPNKYKQKSSHEQTTIKNSSSKEHLTLKAAHQRTDIEVTEEMKKHDENIMNDENF